MRTLATKQPSNDAAKQKKKGNGTRSRSVSPLSTGMSLLQRKCACGGGCPRCKEDIGIQTKLKIGEPGDKYEQEANRIADEVMRMPEPSVQRQVELEEEEEETIQRKAITNSISSISQRQDELKVPSIVSEVLQSPGQPLEPGIRTFMESRFGYDFSQVQVHRDEHTAGLAQDINAKAFTVGQSIVFGTGQYAPETTEGKKLLAHELTHFLQQNQTKHRPPRSINSLPKRASQNQHENQAWQNTITVATEQIQCANRLIPSLPLPAGEAGPPSPLTIPSICVPTNVSRGTRTSSSSISVDYEKDNSNRGEITLRQRENGDRILHTAPFPDSPNRGHVTIPAGITISNEDHHYELEMVFFNSHGRPYGGLGRDRPVIRFEVCRLDPAPTGVHLLFAKAIYAEGVDAGEFPYVRDLVYNRIEWVRNTCPGDRGDFGHDISSVLNAPNQFGSVLGNSSKFQQLEDELNARSGSCQYTTPPRPGSPARCRLVNAALQAEAVGNRNTHNYLFFRSDTSQPSRRAVNRWQYPGGNYYWEISGCPSDRQGSVLFQQLRALGMPTPPWLE